MDTPKTNEQIAFVKEQLAGDTFGPECPDRPYYVLSVMGSFARLQELEIAELEAENKELIDVNIYEHGRAEAAESKLRAVAELPDEWRSRTTRNSEVDLCAMELEALLQEQSDE